MRVSAGFLVIGLSGKMRIQILPPRLTWRVIAIRAASIWRAVMQPRSSGLQAELAERDGVAALRLAAHPALLLLRYLTFLGCSMRLPRDLVLSALRRACPARSSRSATSPLKIQHFTPMTP